MGLDMYLSANRYVWNNEEAIQKAVGDAISVPDWARVKGVTVEVGYWRKANHIHNWFVENVQNGVDDCGMYEVSMEQLNALRQVCVLVLESKDDEVSAKNLPTQSGFFFGSTAYDEYYYQDVEDTIKIIDHVLSLDFNAFTLEYHSSW